jgi:hypothetical protein
MFARPRAKPRLGLGGSGVARCYHLQVPAHKLHALLANLKRLVLEKLSLTLPVGLLSFHLAFGGWKAEWVLTLHLSLLFFSGSYLGVFENFAKKDKVPRMVSSITQVVFVTSPKSLSEPLLLLLWLVCGSLGRVSMRLTCAHNNVEPKTGSKKKLVMQLDQDVQVCGIFLCFF